MYSPFKKKKQPRLLNMNIPVRKGYSSAFSSTSDSFEAAKNNLLTLLQTRPGERFQSDFGCNLKSYLFDNITDEFILELKNDIKNSIARWLPYIEVINIDLKDNFNSQFSIEMRFKLKGTQYEDTLEILI